MFILHLFFFLRKQIEVANLSITNEFIPIQAAAVRYLAWGFLRYEQHIGFSCLYFPATLGSLDEWKTQ